MSLCGWMEEEDVFSALSIILCLICSLETGLQLSLDRGGGQQASVVLLFPLLTALGLRCAWPPDF